MNNILIIHQSADLYGSDRTLFLLLKYLDREKFNPVVVLPLDGPLREELEKINIEVHIAPVLKIYRNIIKPKNILNFFSEYKSAVKFLDTLHKKHHFNIIYSNTLAVLLGMIYAKKTKIKHIWHVHEIIVHPNIVANFFPKLLKKYADVVVCNSKATLENLLKREPSLKSKAIVIYNGMITKENYNTIDKEDLGFTNEDILVTLVGRISRLKGHKWLLNTYIKYLKNSNIKLLFVGSPVEGQEFYLKEIEQILISNRLLDRVKILQFTKQINPIFKVSDIIVTPSTEAESFGLVALEAMLAKKPVIGTNLGGLKEIIVNNETGYLVEVNNENEFAKSIIELAENKNKREMFGLKGYERALKNFPTDNYVMDFESLFISLLNKD